MHEQRPDINYLFEPGSIAVIGASSDTKKIGYSILSNIVQGYQGEIYPINPKGGEALGLPMKTSLADIGKPVDMAVIAIPARFVFDSVRECADAGVKVAVIITSGFSEVGNTEEEKAMTAYAKERGMRVLGPNIFGVYSAASRLNATFGPKNVVPGSVAIITQSGALGLAMVGKTAVENIGLSAIVSLGNKADLDEADSLEYLMDDPNTKVIMMYIEGVKKGQRLVETLRKVTSKKPVIVIKSGRSARGAMAAASHTGSLAGADEVFDDIMRQVGVIRAESIQNAFDWFKLFTTTGMSKGENTVIVTNGGGIGVMATDACEKYGVPLYDNIAGLKTIFGPATPDFGSTKNPIDITGQARAQEYTLALDAALESDDIHSVIALYCETAVFTADSLKGMIEETFAKYKAKGKPIIYSIFGGAVTEQVYDQLRVNNVPVFPDVYQAVSCFGAMGSFKRHSEQEMLPPVTADIDLDTINGILDKALSEERHFLLAHEATKVMAAAGIGMPRSMVARSIEQAVQFAQDIGYPVVMKIVSKDIIHKSDAGGVALNLENKDEVMDAYQAIIRNARAYKPGAKIDGVEVVEMVTKGAEIIVGARKDHAFGPIVMVGMGGIYVEVMKDVSFRSLPINQRELLGMIKDIKSYKLLLGVRGEDPKDIDALIDTMVRLGAIIQKVDRISDIEVNPVVVYEQGRGVRAVDARILLSKQETR